TLLKNIVKSSKFMKVEKIVKGGSTRQKSSYNGLNNCPKDTRYVLIHDAARPFVTDTLIKKTLDSAKKYCAVTTAVDVTDTTVKVKNNAIIRILDRKKLRSVQTPQGFDYYTILMAHKFAASGGIKDASDDAGLVLSMGEKVHVIRGEETNIKITDKKDLSLAELFLRRKTFGNQV
ncbi:MAG: 2-C-methyl-D-erythritol 4-phosphate cytidylyltransferase, partial [Candidatus Omnitrophica bacterium]|nr:2-C-methyl-D-erythritol 4-phosphate cytidylyltransferase [Candidatus Omnitrophota bacterium]